MNRAVWWLAGVAAAAAVAVTVGCGQPAAPAAARVEGRVTFQGRPLAGGVVVFVPDADRNAAGGMHTAAVDGDGGYRLADGAATVPPGWYRVALAEPAGVFAPGTFPPPLRRPDRSGLERQVKPGHDHRFDFEVELTR